MTESVFTNTNDAMVFFDTSSKIVRINTRFTEMFGYELPEVSGRHINSVVDPHQKEARYGNQRILARETVELEVVRYAKSGRPVQVLLKGGPVIVDGVVTGGYAIYSDITERKQAEEEIQKQLSEKELLLREVHHRVKNNMANVESLLSLQADSTANAEVKAALQEAISRVQSMRVLYDKLLFSEDLREVSIKFYAEGLIDSLAMVFNPERSVTIEKSISDFMIDAKKVFSVGIIISELLTNVFKYAFKDRDKGMVSVSIAKEKNEATLIIHDNGTGFDERALANESPGFGLTVVKMLAEQLGGTYTLSNESGAKTVVQFEI